LRNKEKNLPVKKKKRLVVSRLKLHFLFFRKQAAEAAAAGKQGEDAARNERQQS
jgi:hypothetical protein